MQIVGTHEEEIKADNLYVVKSQEKKEKRYRSAAPTKNSVDQGIHDTTEKFMKEKLSNALKMVRSEHQMVYTR